VKPRQRSGAPQVTITRAADHEVIEPRNVLKAKAAVLLAEPRDFDETAIRRAEQALKALSINFNGWMEESVRNLSSARHEVKANGPLDGRASRLHRVAHDIRGQAATLGFPLAARVGASLCRILEAEPASKMQTGHLARLVDQHIDAIAAIVREGVTNAQHRVGEALTSELETITDRLLSGKAARNLH
jgi:hypothetical protein